MKLKRAFAAVLFSAFASSAALAQDGALIASMDEMRFQPPKQKGRAELVEGKVGKALRLQFDQDSSSTFFTSNIHGTPEWDRAQGLSFWVKGEGVDGFGGIELIYDEDYSVRYDYCFTIKGTAWKKIVVAWRDLIPVLPGPRAKPLGTPGGNAPGKITGFWIGKWWYWRDYPAITFTIDEIRLEPTIVPDRNEAPLPRGDSLERVRSLLKAGKPITIVTMGDSLTDKRHWANRDVCWVDTLRQKTHEKYHSDVTIVNPAIGGTQLRQNVVLIPRWLDTTPSPDLVTIFFGFNDWDAGMRGEEFRRACDDAIDRIRRATNGKADVLIMTTNPAASRWTEAAELAAACRLAAQDRRAALADTEHAFHDAGKIDRDRLFVHDKVHLSRAGHELVAESVLAAITAGP
jgi:lysophospholipase L1-like esterase